MPFVANPNAKSKCSSRPAFRDKTSPRGCAPPCDATAFLELDHIIPRGLGGGTEPENLRVRCRAHNRLWAEQVFGRAHIDRVLHFRQRKYRVTANDGSGANEMRRDHLEKQGTDSALDAREKVVLALKQLGLRRSQAQRAVCAVEKRRCLVGAQTLEGRLREALLEATKAA